MPAVHISQILNLLENQSSKTELRTTSSSLLHYALTKLATSLCSTQKKIFISVFPSPEALEEALLFAESSIFPKNNSPIQLCVWRAWEHSPFSPIASSLTQRIDRIKTLSALHSNAPTWIFTTAESWAQPTLPPEVFAKNRYQISVGSSPFARDEWSLRLKQLGYVKADQVDEPGQWAIRGEIIDVFVPSADQPYRIELFDTEVERIRQFHPETQRTLPNAITQIQLDPAEEVLFPWDDAAPVLEKIKSFADENAISRKIRDPLFENIRLGFLPENFRTWLPFVYSSPSTLQNHLPDHTSFVMVEPERLEDQLHQYLKFLKNEELRYQDPHWIAPKFKDLYLNAESQFKELNERTQVYVRSQPQNSETAIEVQADPLPQTKISLNQIQEWIDDEFQILIGSKSLSHRERIKHSLGTLAQHPQIKILAVHIKDSFDIVADKTILLSENLVLGVTVTSTKPRASRNPNAGEVFQSVKELAVGDYVVHSLHGVGKYLGLQELTSQGKPLGEYLLIEYANQDKLFLPIYRLNFIQKHVGAAGNPAVDKLGNNQFEKSKQKARESARKLAVNLLEIYAKRATLRGPVFDPRGAAYDEFCDQFPFSETEGQLKAIDDIFADVESGRLLDRLVCGDVGFGKTEVAMRAAFQAVQSGYQVAVLVPTTLLAFQHEQTLLQRMKQFPIRIESLSRFKTKREQTGILEDLSNGKIDIIVGTHRLLSKDVRFKQLGLLVIDEEHRFGVDHKEKIKALQTNTHALTLTATPIPRTLNMAISGIKDISLIRTPPSNRQPIKTYVSSFSDELVKSAIENELSRGGQIFYLYNRVQSIEHRAKEIQRLVPHAKIITAHGQMTEDQIEQRMLEFYQGRAQILVCTTIIESGIDVPNAGTIIIHRADQLGLAQLYQIRGRVGRSHRKAFAYLLVFDEELLTQDAKLRLEALQRFVELGSGFQIASEDLEIRGGGNLLGPEQSGHIASVGLDLFTELLEESIQELRGQKGDSNDSVEERHFEPEIQVPVVCEIPQSSISDSQVRLSFYRKLSRAQSDAAIDELQAEFQDRFGSIPEETVNLFWLIRIKNLLKLVGIEMLSATNTKSVFTVRKTSKIDLNEVMKVYAGPKTIRDPRISLTPDSKIIFSYPFSSLKDLNYEIESLFRKIAPKAFENHISD